MSSDELYEQAAQEIRRGILKEGLWLKCMVEANGDEARAKREYLQERVLQLKMEHWRRQEQQMGAVGRFLDRLLSAIFFWVKPKTK